jgi:hypothetical protein
MDGILIVFSYLSIFILSFMNPSLNIYCNNYPSYVSDKNLYMCRDSYDKTLFLIFYIIYR